MNASSCFCASWILLAPPSNRIIDQMFDTLYSVGREVGTVVGGRVDGTGVGAAVEGAGEVTLGAG